MSDAKWYVVHTYSGYENKVCDSIKKTVENRHLEDQIFDVIVPLETAIEMKDDVAKTVQRKMFPGYVLVNMIMNDDSWYVIRNTRGVTGFVGPGSKPVPLTEAEIKSLGISLSGGSVETKVSYDFKVGDTITVTSGVWENTVGVVKYINEGKSSLTISVDMFGRETPVELKFAEVKKF
ncbi:MAG: transcription termination/antitermination protein NusG [Lachnospiraceae bacterium]